MCIYEKQVREALKTAGATHKSSNRHEKYELPDGRCITLAVSPSDADYWVLKWRDVRKTLNLNEGRGEPGERREKFIGRGFQRAKKPTILDSVPEREPFDQQVRALRVNPIEQTRGKIIVHPTHRTPRPVADQKALELDALLTKFERTRL